MHTKLATVERNELRNMFFKDRHNTGNELSTSAILRFYAKIFYKQIYKFFTNKFTNKFFTCGTLKKIWIFRYLDNCPKNDVISFSEKVFEL